MGPTVDDVQRFISERGLALRKDIEDQFGSGEPLDMTLKFLTEKRKASLARYTLPGGECGEVYYIPYRRDVA